MENNLPPRSFNKLKLFQNLLGLSAAALIITVWSIVIYLSYKSQLLSRQLRVNLTTSNNKQTENDLLENWITYINTSYDYEVMYPPNWTVKEKFAPKIISFLPPSNVIDNNNPDSTGEITIVVDGWGPQVSTAIDVQKNFQSFMSDCSSQTPTQCTRKNNEDYFFEKQITIAGQPAFQTYGGCCMDIGRHVFLFSGSNHSFTFTLYNLGTNKTDLLNEDIFNQILLSFKFIEKSKQAVIPEVSITPIPIDISNWLNYEDYYYGFKFMYPISYILQETSGGGRSYINNNISLAKFITTDNKTLEVFLDDSELFSVENLKKYAPTGSEDIVPTSRSLSGSIFYYYGPGGGGVCYPDQYFYNLRDQILIFEFYGCENDKQPPEDTKIIEQHLLSSFEITN